MSQERLFADGREEAGKSGEIDMQAIVSGMQHEEQGCEDWDALLHSESGSGKEEAETITSRASPRINKFKANHFKLSEASLTRHDLNGSSASFSALIPVSPFPESALVDADQTMCRGYLCLQCNQFPSHSLPALTHPELSPFVIDFWPQLKM